MARRIMARSLPPLLALSLLAASGSAEVSIQPRGGRLDVAASRAPVADVLDRLARQTGMKVVYEGVPPRQLVTLAVRDRTPAEAVVEVLEGLGLNYALIADPTGARVQTLMVASRSAPATSASPAGNAPSARAPEPNSHRAYVPPGGMAPEEPVEDTPDNVENPGAVAPELNNPPQGPMGQPPINQVPQPAGAAPVPQQQPTTADPPWISRPGQYPASPFAPQPVQPPMVPAQPGVRPATPGTPQPQQQP